MDYECAADSLTVSPHISVTLNRMAWQSVRDCRSLSLTAHFVRSFVHSFIRSFVRSFIRSFVRSCVHSFVRLFVHSFVRSFVRRW